MNAGYSFISASVKAVESEPWMLNGYRMLDLILGKQKETLVGRGAVPSRYKAFTPALMAAVTQFTQQGGSVLVTGAYVGSDIWDKRNPAQAEVNFARDVLGFQWVDCQATLLGQVYTVPTIHHELGDNHHWTFCNKLNGKLYAVESPDAVKASDDNGATFLRYTENNIPAGIVSDRNGYRTVVTGVPFEVFDKADQRNTMMQEVLNFFEREYAVQ